jgi:sensor histidine kinase regulating citrate/malate metabolism
MEGISTDAFKRKTSSPQSTIRKILDLWAPLLAMKKIIVNPLQCIDINDGSTLYMSEIEFYIIINNFILNSAWFLEKADVEQREITITLSDNNHQLILDMENNGLPLDDIFANNPGRIFEAGVTSKSTKNYEGTGLGLWIMRTVVENNSGQILISDKRDGFGLRIFLPK